MSSVWVQLYYEGKKEPEGGPSRVYQSDLAAGREWDIDGLRKLVKDKLAEDLTHCSPAMLFVCSPGIPKPSSQDNALKAWDPIPPNSSGQQPLIVVAPAPPQEPANEKIDYVYAYLQEKKQEEATIQFTKPKLSRYQRAVQNIGVRIDAPEWENDHLVGEFNTLGSGMAAFTWGPRKEDCLANRSLYLAYLRNNQNIGLPHHSKLFDGTEEPELLSTDIVSFGVKTKGNIDVVLAHKHHQETSTTRHNMWAGGIFFLFSKEKNQLMAYQAQSKGEANYLIRHIMDSSGSASAPISVPTDFLNRASWNKMFPPREDDTFMEEAKEDKDPDEGGGQDSSGKSGRSRKGGLSSDRAQQNRQSTAAGATSNSDIAGSANVMGNSLDFMDDEEEREARFKDVLECILPQLGVFPHRELGHDHYAEGPPNHIGVLR
ncbi:hypothetical protein SEMRO_382_G130940.1 [Seminavis robusta]|uniref:Uncharacterized protein n=1 Tax=Seminavis robusta TaxID=568900 RepID=A0A9N8E077_9STRA|nr:hypothetical protein SEMRO_382_G130940.1 [Seminavis robusta]|eukprot:Sro382_g130940.1 n/a (430) ;mRNA; r:2842-4509